MTRLTLVSDTTDRELAAIRRTVETFDLVSGEPAVVAILRERAADKQRYETLDLVGHSGDHGFLRLGDWIVDDSPQTANSFDSLLRPSLEAIGLRTIRLLGCVTAMSPRAWAVITLIGRAARCRVLGTRRYIGSNDYRTEGFISDDALAGAPGARPERQDRIGFLPRAASTIPIETIAMVSGPKLSNDQSLLPVNVDRAREMVSLVDGTRSWVIPGLLAQPSPIVLWSHANAIHRLDILLDREAVRVYGRYPDDEHGRLYLVRDSMALTRLLAAQDRTHTGSQARKT